jgi:hypothetical protein
MGINEDDSETQQEWEESSPESEPPTFDEVNGLLSNLRNNKAPSTDGIPAELLKNGGPHLIQKLYHSYNLGRTADARRME